MVLDWSALLNLLLHMIQQVYCIRLYNTYSRVATSPRFLESESSLSPACLESSPSPSLTGQDLSSSPAGFEPEPRCLLLESESESHVAEISQL